MARAPKKDLDSAKRHKSRKAEHVEINLKEDVRSRHNFWDDVHLVHHATPEVDFDDIDLATHFLKKELNAPLMIASMTGGYPDAEKINGALASAAAKHRVALGVGSQRTALVDPKTVRSYTVVRDHDVPFVAANIGAPQLVAQRKPALTYRQVDELVSMIEADALIVHLNFLQEAVQPEGDLHAKGCVAAIRDLAQDLGVPVMAKETGAGIDRRAYDVLAKAGVRAIDVGGLSGTTFAAVELVRARREQFALQTRIGELYRDWGVPTPVSLLECRGDLPLVATGGVQNGLAAAKSLALGATLAGIASSALKAAVAGDRAADEFLASVIAELRTGLLLTGAGSIAAARRSRVVVTGATRDWLLALGHDVGALARA
ncbi:MAG: type 2 isopentenyl-diphosphate Delta-isomerase [Methanobacteriota archaeon]